MDIYASNNVIVCKEINQNNADDISVEEIIEYAKTIGIDCDTEKYLLPIAKKALLQQLPNCWVPCFDKIRNRHFYYNIKSGISQWEHPLDDIYRNLIEQLREECKKGTVKEFELAGITNEMLPLRQSRKPQLVPIEQLLKSDRDKRPTSASYNENFHDRSVLRPRSYSVAPSSKKKKTNKKTVTFYPDDQFVSHMQQSFPYEISSIKKNIKDPSDSSIIPASVHTETDHDLYGDTNISSPVSQMRSLHKDNDWNFASDDNERSFVKAENNLRRSNNVLFDSAVFTGSNMDDTSKNVLSNFTNSDLSSTQSDNDSNNLLNAPVEAVHIKPKQSNTTIGLRENNVEKLASIREELHTQLKNKLNEEISQLKNSLKDEIMAQVTSRFEKDDEKFQELQRTQERKLQEITENSLEKVNVCQTEAVSAIKNETSQLMTSFKSNNAQYDLQTIRNMLAAEMTAANQEINHQIRSVVEDLINGRLEKCKTEMITEISGKQIYTANLNAESTATLKKEILQDIRKENEEQFQKIKVYIDSRDNDVVGAVNKNVLELKQKTADLSNILRALETESHLDKYKENLRLFVDALKNEILTEVLNNTNTSTELKYNDATVQTSLNSLPKNEVTSSVNAKLDQLLNISVNLEQRIADLLRVQETIKNDNLKIKEKCLFLEDRFNQLVNITNISISDLDIDVPRRYLEENENDRTDNNFVDIRNETVASTDFTSLTKQLQQVDWKYENYIPLRCSKTYNIDENINEKQETMANVDKDINKHRHIIHFQNPF